MRKPKSLGQIVYEADTEFVAEFGPWKSLTPAERVVHERIAAVVARAVRRRGKKEKGT